MRKFEQVSSSPQEVISPVSSYQRDLRYILTQKCNYQCGFCHKEGCDGSEKELLSPDDYEYLYDTITSTTHVQGVTLSGGEPLLSKNIRNILPFLKQTGPFLSMVTNGYFIDKHIDILGSCDRINISLHTLQQDIYNTIIGKDIPIQKILDNIVLLKKTYPHIDIRINSALLKEYFTTPLYLENMLDFIQEHDLTIKYLELSPKTDANFIPNSSLIPLLQKKGFVLEKHIDGIKNKHTYVLGGAKVILRTCACDFVYNNGLDQEYCKHNNDIVVSPDGRVSSCILDTKKLDLYPDIQERNTKGIKEKIMTLEDPNFRYACCFSS